MTTPGFDKIGLAPSDFVEWDCAINNSPTYWYEGCCPQSGEWLRLPRTLFVEAIAQGLMQVLKRDRLSQEGKMYGVLLVENSLGEQRVLKAFSGLLNGNRIEGWVPPIPGRDRVAFEEAHTLAILESIKQELITLQKLPERSQYELLSKEFKTQLNELTLRHNERKLERQQQRQRLIEIAEESLAVELEKLDEQSRLDGLNRRHLKRQQNAELQPLKLLIEQADNRIRELKQQRKDLSRQLQIQMHNHYWLTNFAGESLSLQQLILGSSMPTGTGDCCAPKLLHYAATHDLKPLAMAEFWWGLPSTNQEKIQGAFYGACAERCQPLMGFLLSGLPQKEAIAITQTLPILYEDKWLVVVNKPPGLLSVPGRYRDVQDSVLSRLRHLLPNGETLIAVHRLDRDTSGILLLARDRQTYNQLSQQFEQRQVHKIYEAMLNGSVIEEQGVIDLPLWGDPQNRPIQTVDRQRGKPSMTHFKLMARTGDLTRMEFSPITGRTHQIRVHAADRGGLGVAILGDRLYGVASSDRLHLHARTLRFEHPQSRQTLQLTVDTPF